MKLGPVRLRRQPAARGAGQPEGSHALFILAVGLFVALLIASPPSARRSDHGQTAQGYVRVVNQLFIPNRWLETATAADDEQNLGFDSPEIRLSRVAQREERIREFVRNSYLARDIVQETPIIWSIENGQVIRLDPSAHAVALPSAPPRRWEGNLRFRESAPATVQSLLRSDLGDIILEPPDFNADPGHERFNILGGRQSVRAPYVRIQEGSAGVVGHEIADLMLWGATPIITPVEGEQAYYQVFVDGERVSVPGRRAMAVGGSMRITSAHNNTDRTFALIERVTRSPEISLYRPWGGERQRAGPTAALARAVENSLQRAVASEDYNGPHDFDVRLTIDAEMQEALDSALESFVSDPRNARFIGAEHQIGVTIMDALSGEILALGSHIRLSTDEQRRPDAPPPLDINFRRLQIGSAAKPLITAAIIDVDENRHLAELELLQPAEGDGEELGEFLGVRFREGNTLSDKFTSCNFDCFIQHSNNRYAITLMLLANARQGGRLRVSTPGAYAIRGEVRNDRPLSIFEARGADGLPVFDRVRGAVVQGNWHSNIRDLFDVDYETPDRNADSRGVCQRRDGQFGDDVFNMNLWRDLQVERFSMVSACVFYGASPERENFRLDSQNQFETHMLPVMIGGGEARWTNVMLAQSYARLVTGRPVSARLYARAGANGDDAVRGAFRMDPGARRRLTHAMTLVTRGGTARSFPAAARLGEVQSALQAQGAALGVFSKTGTPQLDVPYYDAVSRSLNLLIRLNVLRMNRAGALELLIGDRTIAISDRNVGELRRVLSTDAAARAALTAEGASLTRVVRRLIAENSRTREARRARFQIDRAETNRDDNAGDILVRVIAPDETLKRYGKVFVFVVGRYPLSAPMEGGLVANGDVRPTRAYAVAINIQSEVSGREEDGGSTASRLGGVIFHNVLREALLEP